MTMRRLWVILVALVVVALAAGAGYWMRKAPSRLETALSMESVDYGIPGITKVYDASVVNRGGRPVRVTRCDFVDDTNSPGSMIAYAIQRWDSKGARWQEVMGSSRARFCHPYPLGIARAHLKREWLWPGQSLSIGEEATAARDGLELGDRVRFVLFTAEPGDYGTSLPGQEFTIDERPTSDVAFRVRH